MKKYDFDVLIIGSGVAGISLALRLAPNAKVALLSKDGILTSSSRYAQGGIAAVLHSTDFAEHIADTANAGAGLCDEEIIHFTVSQSKSVINWLIDQGVPFTRDPDDPHQFHLTQEGGHRQRRIFHVEDSTGAAIINTLTQKLSHPNIHCFTHHTAMQLLVTDEECFGAVLLDNKTEEIKPITARATVIATGGASSVYLHSTNPKASTGDGIAMAWQANCRIANLEFNQFHPTSLFHPTAQSFLISEAVRGEGGKLFLQNGQPFMHKYDARAELAPRDIVARAIAHEMQQHQISHVLLDISQQPAEQVRQLFPMIGQRCLELGIDITQEPIPVVPAAHYTCGGIITDRKGHTDVKNLYAIGEVACTGLHGANRMAGNSLLECLVFAASACEDIQNNFSKQVSSIPNITQIQSSLIASLTHQSFKKQKISEEKIIELTQILRTLMWDNLGITRSNASIQHAAVQIQQLSLQTQELGQLPSTQSSFITLQNRIQVASLMIQSAAARQESRGAHFNTDYLQSLPNPRPTILRK